MIESTLLVFWHMVAELFALLVAMLVLVIGYRFMDGVPHDPGDVTISRAIIALAHSLGLTQGAEGVKTDAQLAFLRQYGCEVYQGWLYAKAMAAADLTEQLRAFAIHV